MHDEHYADYINQEVNVINRKRDELSIDGLSGEEEQLALQSKEEQFIEELAYSMFKPLANMSDDELEETGAQELPF